jgi:imidazolonepropionase-like amidohydrolase
MTHIALVGGKLVDGNGDIPIGDSLVLIDDGKITYAGPRTPIDGAAPDLEGAHYDIVDITGKTVMPGLIDSHLHFTGNESDDDTQWVLDDVTQKTVIAVQQAHDALEAGLTTVGEISRSGIAIRNTINQGLMKGPRMVCTGLGFCRTGGHGDSHKLPLEYNEASHPWAERVDGPWPLRKAVRRRLREDVDAIKIWSTGRGIWRHDDKLLQHYTYEEIKAVVDEASMVHVPV